MHILLGLLGSIATILYIIDRLGIDIGWLNPWSWRRRRAWRNKFEGDPIYSLEDPLQVAGALIVGVARLEGDLSAEQKSAVLQLFADRFSLSERDARQLYTSSAHLLAAPQLLENQLREVARKNTATFTAEQFSSLLEMIESVASTGATMSETQRKYLGVMRKYMTPESATANWS